MNNRVVGLTTYPNLDKYIVAISRAKFYGGDVKQHVYSFRYTDTRIWSAGRRVSFMFALLQRSLIEDRIRRQIEQSRVDLEKLNT